MHTPTSLSRPSAAALALALALAAPSAVQAQTTGGIEAGVQFDFSLPGARSLGMGGAFVSLADDATAAQANPAGLVALTKPELSVEGRGWNFFSSLPSSGHAFGSPTNIGIDTVSGLRFNELKDSNFSAGLISFVYPSERWAVSAYRHQFVNFTNRISGEGPFRTSVLGVERFNPSQGQIDLDIVSYGGSAAVRLTDQFSVGAGVGLYQFDIDVVNQAFLVRPNGVVLTPAQRPLFTGTGQQFGPADFSAANVGFEQQQSGDDTAVAFNAGFLWRGDRWSLGGAYRQGPVFEYSSRFLFGPAFASEGFVPGSEIQGATPVEFHVPDSFALGGSYRVNDALRLNVEYDFVRYSELLNGDGNGRPVETTGKFTPFADAQARFEGEALVQYLTVDDAHQLRVGGEYVVKTGPPLVALRFGTWYDPDHRQRFENPDPTNRVLQSYEIGLPKGENEVHFAAGLGLAFSRFRIDGAFDLSPRINTFSISSVFYLK
jgi:long-subunit fatty acid transport protein